nr:MAG TPA: hypothetical protein [Caudoviricetes sp.]
MYEIIKPLLCIYHNTSSVYYCQYYIYHVR